ncbi:reverse transcriptase domain-containing protein [Tanacetum coccineum]
MTLEPVDDQSLKQSVLLKAYVLMVGKFQFLTDFVVVDFKPDPRVPLILGRSFLKTSHALIDVYEGEITLRVVKEAITFNLDQTSRYTASYDHVTQTKLTSLNWHVKNTLKSERYLLFRNHKDYSHESGRIIVVEAKTVKSSNWWPLELNQGLATHLEYAFLEATISHRLEISDIKGVDPEFCTHKILMEGSTNQQFQIKMGKPKDPRRHQKQVEKLPSWTPD